MIRFTVPGTPVAQGNHRVSRSGYTYEANKKLKPWRDSVVAYAAEAIGDQRRLVVPVRVVVTFAFPRPKSHYRTGARAAELKDSAPIWHAQAPDCDKAQRALGDSLVIAGVLRDDSLIASWAATKIWAETGWMQVDVHPLIAVGPDRVPIEQPSLVSA